MKNLAIFLSVMSLLLVTPLYAQVGVGTLTPDASSMLDIQSGSKGVLIPRMLTSERTTISSPANGLLVYDTDTKSFWYYILSSTTWKELVSETGLADANGDTRVEVEKTTNLDEINFTTAGTERMKIGANGVIFMGDSVNGNFTKVTTDGSLSYNGTATRWDDLRVPMNSLKSGTAKNPSWDKFIDDGGSSQGVYTFWYDPNTEEELFFTVQMPHAWVEGSDLHPHVHWTVGSDPGSTKVAWGLEYTWTNVGTTFGSTSVLTANDPIAAVGTVSANEHVITALGTISGSGKTLSSMLVCRIYRVAGDAANDTYTGDAGLLQLDFHYEIDGSGSNGEYTKL